MKGVRYLLVLGLVVAGMIGGVAVAAMGNGEPVKLAIARIIHPSVISEGQLKIIGNLDNNSVSIVAPDGQVFTARIKPPLMKETGKITENGKLMITIGGKDYVVNVAKSNGLTEEQKQKAIEMALNNDEVKELIKGKNYTVLKVGPSVSLSVGAGNEPEAKVIGASIMLKVEDKCYFVGVNFESSKVDVQEMPCPQ